MRLTRQNISKPRREKIYESDSFKEGNSRKKNYLSMDYLKMK